MEKTSAIIKENNVCEITVLIKNTALIESMSGKTGLLNIKTNEIIGELDNYYTIYDEHNKLYKQRKEICLTDAKKNSWEHDYILRIYDAEEERLIVDNWILEKSFAEYYGLCVLRSPINGKLHIFDKRVCRKDKSIFDLEFDDVEMFSNHSYENYLIVTVNGKKGIYCQGKGLIKPIEYDDIYKEFKVAIFTKGLEKGFADYSCLDGEPLSGFDEIVVNDDGTDFVYCKIDNIIYVYNYRTEDLILEICADEIEFVFKNDCNYERTNIFTFKRNGKFGLISAKIGANYGKVRPTIQTSVLLNADYDEINYENGLFYLKKNNNVGMYSYNHRGSVNISAIYDKIEYLGDNFYAFYNDEKCDIAKLKTPLNPVVKDCKIIENVNEGLIFEKDNTYGVLISNVRRNHRDEDIVLDNYDGVRYLGSGLFELEKNGLKGVCHRGMIIIPLIYENIDLHVSKNKDYIGKKDVYFSLTIDNKRDKLAHKNHWDIHDDEVEYETSRNYRKIEFLPDVMVLKDRRNAYIYDYSKKLLKTLPAEVEVSVIERNPKGYDKKRLYCIDSVYYFYKDEKFEKVLMEESDLYMTAYESDYGIVVVNSYNKQKHDEICKLIENDGEDIFDKTLISYYESDSELQEKYPSLVRKKVPPKSNI